MKARHTTGISIAIDPIAIAQGWIYVRTVAVLSHFIFASRRNSRFARARAAMAQERAIRYALASIRYDLAPIILTALP